MISIRRKKADALNSAGAAQKSGWLHLSQKTDSGLLLLTALANNGSTEPLSLRTIAEKNGLSFYFLQKVAADLKRAGLIEAGRGSRGGYSLSKAPADISIKDVLEAHEGPLALMRCLDAGHSCVRESNCTVRKGLKFINQTIVTTLVRTTLADFINPEKTW
ncbi:Rrf2 family transcriptional regulator [Patescibacteria group bacterium]|nr:Rrf2 family transcriptional regulator [Patescibacteria group bacterium]